MINIIKLIVCFVVGLLFGMFLVKCQGKIRATGKAIVGIWSKK